jgi:hypothetical protein
MGSFPFGFFSTRDTLQRTIKRIFRIFLETSFLGSEVKEKQVPHGSLTELQKATCVIWVVLLIG